MHRGSGWHGVVIAVAICVAVAIGAGISHCQFVP